jgi:hypothetical protein
MFAMTIGMFWVFMVVACVNSLVCKSMRLFVIVSLLISVLATSFFWVYNPRFYFFYYGAMEPFGYPEGITVVLCLPVDFSRLRESGAL